MEKKLVFKVRDDIDVYNDILRYTNFLDCGASKSAFAKDETCWKVPIGYEELDSTSFTKTCEYPYEYKDFNNFIYNTVAEYHPELVWSIGQIVFEVMVWEHLKELEQMGYDISGFARISDYYVDKNGVPVIVQEYVHCDAETRSKLPSVTAALFDEQNKTVLNALEDMGFALTDIRSGNMGYNQEGKLKCFDFGISHGNAIYDYDTYNDYCSGSYNSYYDEEY